MRTRPALCFLALLLLNESGCSAQQERPWQKLGKDYTTAEFNRDRDSCTKEKKLDHACMKAKGWVLVSPDLPEPATASPPRRTPY